MSKRANSEGSIYKRQDGRWVFSLSLSDGRRKSFYGHSQQEVIHKRNLYLSQIYGANKQADQPLSAFLLWWLEEVKRPTVRWNTYIRLRGMVRNHLLPAFGNTYLSELTDGAIRSYMNALEAEGRLSSRSRHYLWETLKAALNTAVDQELILRNPALKVTPPTKVFDVPEPLSDEEIVEFVEAAKTHRLYPLYLLALTTGMRLGECLGLTWDNVDLSRGVVKVRYQAQRLADGMQLVPLKTKASRRNVYLPPQTIDALRGVQQTTEGILNPLNLVFPTKNGTVQAGAEVSRGFKRLSPTQ